MEVNFDVERFSSSYFRLLSSAHVSRRSVGDSKMQNWHGMRSRKRKNSSTVPSSTTLFRCARTVCAVRSQCAPRAPSLFPSAVLAMPVPSGTSAKDEDVVRSLFLCVPTEDEHLSDATEERSVLLAMDARRWVRLNTRIWRSRSFQADAAFCRWNPSVQPARTQSANARQTASVLKEPLARWERVVPARVGKLLEPRIRS